ncbi:MAG: hypothetical protein E6J47_01180 [Chloroflexi bacterium]|nr:MAG: hypothetical protein E6J47_01180 [Chloroflexota bacterium]
MPSLGLLLVLALASLLPASDAVQLANPDATRSDELRGVVAGLPPNALVLVGFDPDLGTYGEIRATVRAALDDLIAHGARLAFVSFTPEGRALAAAELDRMRRAGQGALIADLGFVAGSEAGLVRSVADVVPADAVGAVADSIRARGGAMGAFTLVLVVSGGDLSARSWIEQVRPRLPSISLVAIAPTFLEPELAPYLRSGQLHALLATLRDGVAYANAVPVDQSAVTRRPISALPMLAGMLLALTLMGGSALRRLARGAPRGAG